ncbi:hypothetical protein [Nocardia sp. NPDC058666]|uniref:hypothetical protein n=1 Tax=unclassified Nocardia TaxID=2637762 RepID=UPI003657B0A8
MSAAIGVVEGNILGNKQTRQLAHDPGFGARRARRYTAAFDWVMESIETGHYLEAVAVLDSLLSDRLASRYWRIRKVQPTGRDTAKRLCGKLLNGFEKTDNPAVETDPSFIAVIEAISDWADVRNDAIHATAKIFGIEDPIIGFHRVLAIHQSTAVEGVRLLQAFDELDTASRELAGQMSGTYPNAFFPDRRPRLSSERRPVSEPLGADSPAPLD